MSFKGHKNNHGPWLHMIIYRDEEACKRRSVSFGWCYWSQYLHQQHLTCGFLGNWLNQLIWTTKELKSANTREILRFNYEGKHQIFHICKIWISRFPQIEKQAWNQALLGKSQIYKWVQLTPDSSIFAKFKE